MVEAAERVDKYFRNTPGVSLSITTLPKEWASTEFDILYGACLALFQVPNDTTVDTESDSPGLVNYVQYVFDTASYPAQVAKTFSDIRKDIQSTDSYLATRWPTRVEEMINVDNTKRKIIISLKDFDSVLREIIEANGCYVAGSGLFSFTFPILLSQYGISVIEDCLSTAYDTAVVESLKMIKDSVQVNSHVEAWVRILNGRLIGGSGLKYTCMRYGLPVPDVTSPLSRCKAVINVVGRQLAEAVQTEQDE